MIWVWVAVAVVVVAAGALIPVVVGRNRPADGGDAAISARERYELLGHYVENPVATTDTEAEELLRRGRERWNSAGAVLSTARAAADFQLAERVAGEGLAAVTEAYARMGIAGPPS